MANFGETLRRERELRDISLREIADATKINLRYLEALEQNRFDILPGGVFNKGFIRAYARFIGADGETFVDSYLQEMAAREAHANGGGATATAAGLHRPSESPKRRAAAEPAAPIQAPPGNGEPTAQPMTITEAAGRPATVPAPHIVFLEAQASARAGANSRPSALIVAITAVGVAAMALLGLWLVRGPRPAASRRAPTPTPASAVAPSTAVESPDTADPGPEALPASDDPVSRTEETGRIDANAATAGGPTIGSSPANPAPTTTPGQSGPSPAPPERQAEPSRREAFIDQTANPGSVARPASTPSRIQVASPVAPPLPGLAAQAPHADAAAPGSMEFRIEATAPVWVQIACDGDDRLNRALQPGEGVTLRCLSFIRLSVTDVGAVRLTVNGGRCATPGERGSRIEGFVIRAEDATVICPSQQGAAHGRN